MSNSKISETYEKPHSLVDFEAINNAKKLYLECENFMLNMNDDGDIPVDGLFSQLSRLRTSKAKRRDEFLETNFKRLQIEIKDQENILRNLLGWLSILRCLKLSDFFISKISSYYIVSNNNNHLMTVGDIVDKKKALRLQGKHLQARLEACE
jgi:hypothetical protein